MEFYTDEEKAALSIIENRDLGFKPSVSIYLLAKHYLYVENLSSEDTEKAIIDFIKNKTKINYKPSHWEKCISGNIERAKKFPQIKIDTIIVTKSEISKIQTLKSKPLRRLAFTLLCLAKYRNKVTGTNDNWINCPVYQLFKLANIANRTQAERLCMLNELYKLDMIKYSKKNTNTNVCVTYVDNANEVAVEVKDMRELGKEYSLYCGEKYIRCVKCEILFKPRSNKSKYCKNCAKYQPIEIKTITCCDCGKEFETDSSSRVIRCESCHRNAILLKNKRYNEKRKNVKN